MMAARRRAHTAIIARYLQSSRHDKIIKSLTGDNQGVDGNTIVFVLFVGVRAPQTQPSQEGSEEIKEEADHDQSCGAADVAWRIERVRTPGPGPVAVG